MLTIPSLPAELSRRHGAHRPLTAGSAQQLSLCCALGFLRLEKESTRHPFHSRKNLPVICAGFCRGRAMLS